MKKFWNAWCWEIVILAIFGGLAVMWLSSCGPRIVVPEIVRPPTDVKVAPETTAEHARVESAEEKVDRLTGDLEAAQSQLDHARAAERDARLAGVRTLITWLTAILVLVGILSVGAYIFLRVKSLLVLTAACGVMVATAQASNVLLDHPMVAGLAVLVIVAGAVLAIFWKQRHTERGLVAAVQVADSLKPEEESDVERMERRIMQSKLVEGAGKGALAAIESARDKIAAWSGTVK